MFHQQFVRFFLFLGLLLQGVAGAVTCDVNGDSSLLPNVGDLAELLGKVNAGSTTGACASLGCDFDGNGAAAPTAQDYEALVQIILTEDQGGVCVAGIALKGTLEKPEDLPAQRTASRTLDPTLVRVSAYNLVTGEKLSQRDAQVDGFGGFTVKVPPSNTARDILLLASDGAKTLKTVVEDVGTADAGAGKIDFASTLAAAVYADGVSQSQNPSMSTIKTQLVTGGYAFDGVAFENPPGDNYINKVVSCLGGGQCTVDNAQSNLALKLIENNYIATYFFGFAFTLYKDFAPTGRMASWFTKRAGSAAITCALGETKVSDNICFSLDTGLTIQDQSVPNMSCLMNGKIGWTQTQESVNGVSKTFQWMKGPLVVSGCAARDVLENGVIDVDVKVFWGLKKTPANQFYMSLQHIRNSSIKYRSTESSLKAAMYIPQGDGDVCLPLGLTCPTTLTPSMAGSFTVTFENKQANLTSTGTFAYPASNGNLAVADLVGVTRDGSQVNIPYKITQAEQLELNGAGTITLSGGSGTLTYDTTEGNFKFNATTGGFVRYSGPDGASGQATYNLDGTGSANLIQAGTNIGQLSWQSLTEQASLYFTNNSDLPRANVFVIAK